MSKKLKRNDFKHVETLSNSELSNRLTAIAEGIKKGVLYLSSENDSLNLQPAPLGKIEIKANQKKRGGSILITLSWKNKKAELVEELLDLAKLDADLFDALLVELSTSDTHPEVTEALVEVKEELAGKAAAAKPVKVAKNSKAKKVKKAEKVTSKTPDSPTLNQPIAKAIKTSDNGNTAEPTESSVLPKTVTQTVKGNGNIPINNGKPKRSNRNSKPAVKEPAPTAAEAATAEPEKTEIVVVEPIIPSAYKVSNSTESIDFDANTATQEETH